MTGGLGLGAYLSFARRGSDPAYAPTAPRPRAEVVWAHASTDCDAQALLRLFERLLAQRDGVAMILTCAPGVTRPDACAGPVICEQVVADLPEDIARFLTHWRPNICLWTRGDLRPALIRQAQARGVPLFLVNADAAGFEARLRLWPDANKRALAAFDAIFAIDAAAVVRLERLGVPGDRLHQSGPLQEGRPALPHDPDQRDDLATVLAGRPVWLAAMLQPDELPIVTEAHRTAQRMAHRLLLIIVPDDETLGGSFASALDDEGWRVARWSKGEIPGENTQILLADTRGDLGLWYRVAPVTLMGSSLIPGHGGRDPYEPAALGSAILYGPNVGRHLAPYSRFASAGGARIVRDTHTLAAAVSRVIAPDQAASMAHAAWQVMSDGAEVTDRLIDLIQDTLDVTGSM